RVRPGHTVVDDLVSEISELIEKDAVQWRRFGGSPPQRRRQVAEQQRADDRWQTPYARAPCPHGGMLAVDLLSLLGEAAMRTDKGFELLTLAVDIGHEEQHTRWVRRDDRRDLLEKRLLFVRVTTEYDQISHTGPRHWRPRLRRLRIVPEAREFFLNCGEIDLLRGSRSAG